MSTTRGIRTTIGVALASSVFLLAGCSSSGSVGGKGALGGDKSSSAPAGDSSSSSKGSSSGGDSSSSSSPSGGSSSSSSDSSSGSLGGGEDPGCQAALDAASNAMKNMNVSDPAGAKKALQDIAGQMHAAAGKSKKPEAAAAINKVADDYSKIAGQLGSGVPDMSALQSDATAMATACV